MSDSSFQSIKLSQFILIELFFEDTVDLVLSGEITSTLAFGGDGQNTDPQSMDYPNGPVLKWTTPKKIF